ncbi:MAG: PD40 domain-containing protein [Acidobacteria bacterium]|nr:PD40 domain-containing protein [Acidobacteriota bacterium]
MRRLTPLLVNLAIAAAFRLMLPMTLADGGERYLYYVMSLFFPLVGCANFQCFRFLPPLVPSLLPFQVIDSFIATGFICQVLAGTLLWHIAQRLHPSRRVAWLTVCWFWVAWGALATFSDPLLIADPVQALWLVTALLLLLDGRYLLALPVLVSGAGVKESVLTVPVVYAAYLVLSGEDIRKRIPWLAVLIAVPLATWVVVRRVLLNGFSYASPGDARYLTHPYLFGLWLNSLGSWPHSLVIAALYIFSGFGAAWIFGALGLWRGDRRMRALSAASAPAMAFLALYQEPHRAVACFPWAVLIPAAAYVESLPLPLMAAVFVVNAAFTIRMSATVSWLPSASVLFAILIALIAASVYLKRSRRVTAEPVAAPFAPSRGGFAVASAVVALAIVLLVLVSSHVARARSFRETALAQPPSGIISVDEDGTPGLAVAPDETRIIFTGKRGGNSSARQLWLTTIGSTTAEAIAGTEGASAPFWSPDGRAVGFFADGVLKRVDLASHDVRVLAVAPESHGGAWAPGGTILFAAGSATPLQRVAATGGPATPATALDAARPRTAHRWPHMLPDGRHFLFTEIGPAIDEGVLRLGSLGSNESRLILKDAYAGVYARPGVVLFAREGAVRLQPFDLRRLSVFPPNLPTSLPLMVSAGFSRAAMTVATRTLAFAVRERPPDDRVHVESRWYDRAGRPLDRAAEIDFRRVESADGRQVASISETDNGRLEILTKPAGGAARTVVINVLAGSEPTSFSPDGRVLLYTGVGDQMGIRAVDTRTRGDTPATPLFRDASHAVQAQFSPDGRWIAYSTEDQKRLNVYVQPYPPTGDTWIVSTDGGEQPRWRPDGRELFYIAERRFVMAVDVNTEDGFRLGGRRSLFEVRMPGRGDARFQYAVSPDGQRLLVNTITDPERSARVNVIVNWTRALKLIEK